MNRPSRLKRTSLRPGATSVMRCVNMTALVSLTTLQYFKFRGARWSTKLEGLTRASQLRRGLGLS